MKKTIFCLIAIALTIPTYGQTTFPITANILKNVFSVRTDTLSGTCFLIEDNGHEYIITAKHLFKSSLPNNSSTKIMIYKDDKFQELDAKYHIATDTSIDMAVLTVERSLKTLTTYPIDGNVLVGQDVYFIGFPSFGGNQYSTYSNKIGTIPLVKKGIFSGGRKINDYILFYLDGHNNPGFSGGPVVCKELNSNNNIIIGMISGYYYEEKQLKEKNKQIHTAYIQENSGIIRCFPIKIAKGIIENIKQVQSK